MASKKNDAASVLAFTVMAVLYPFFWVYEKFGLVGLVLFLGVLIGVACFFIEKRKEKQAEIKPKSTRKQRTTVARKQSLPEKAKTEKQPISDQEAFYKQFVSECWRTISEPSPHPDISREANLYFMQHPLNREHCQCIRSLQIIRDSIDIISVSKKEDTILSRMGVIGMHYEGHEAPDALGFRHGLKGYQSLFRTADYDRIHERFSELVKEVHTVVYLNVADGHLEKMATVKLPKTKLKYFNLAVDALERGLTDPDADLVRLNTRLDQIKAQADLVQKQP